jgi:DNA-directed RNA polymerase subunit omega
MVNNMLNPSYTELTDVLNNQQNMDNKITSRYSIVLAAAKRARQLIDGAEAAVRANADKAVSTAVKEMYEGHLDVQLNMDKKQNIGLEMFSDITYIDDVDIDIEEETEE